MFPVVCGSADDRSRDRPARDPPRRDRPRSGAQPRRRESRRHDPRGRGDPAGQPLARVFKTISDPYVGHISLLKVISGTIRPDTVLESPHATQTRSSTYSRCSAARKPSPIAEAQAGDIVAVPKLGDTATGDTLAPKGTPVVVPAPEAGAGRPVDRDQSRVPRATRTS